MILLRRSVRVKCRQLTAIACVTILLGSATCNTNDSFIPSPEEEADGPDVPAEGGITDLRIELKEDLILRIKWKNPSPSPNTETGLWIASSNSKGEVWSIPNECSNIADSEDENQVYFKNGALTCSDGSAHSALSLVLQSCTKYDVTLTLVDSTNTTILPVANGSFVNKQLLPTDLRWNTSPLKIAPDEYELRWWTPTACITIKPDNAHFVVTQTNVAYTSKTVDRKMWALDLLEGCDSSDVHHGMVPCKLTFKIQQSCVSYSIDYWGTTVWKLLIPSVSKLSGRRSPNDPTASNPIQIDMSWELDCPIDTEHTFLIKLTDSINKSATTSESVTCPGKNRTCTALIPSSNSTFKMLPCSLYNISIDQSNETVVKISPRSTDLQIKNLSLIAEIRETSQLRINLTVRDLHYRCFGQLDAAILRLTTLDVTKTDDFKLHCNRTSTCLTTTSVKSLDICRENRVEVALMYLPRINDTLTSALTWFNATLPPVVNKTESNIVIDESSIQSQKLTLNWTDPVCWLSVISAWRIILSNSTNNLTVHIPYNCSATKGRGAAKAHTAQLVRGQFDRKQCGLTNTTNSLFDLASCATYTVKMIPINERNTAGENYLQAAEFTAPLFNQSITNLEAHTVTSFNFQLRWKIPRLCSNLMQTGIVEIDNKIRKINPANLNITKADEYSSYVNWNNTGSEHSCTSYNVRVGSAKLNIITPPSLKDIKFDEAAITAELIGKNGLKMKLHLTRAQKRCFDKLRTASVRIIDDNPMQTKGQELFCNQSSSVCENSIKVNSLDLCRPNWVEIDLKFDAQTLLTYKHNKSVPALVSKSDQPIIVSDTKIQSQTLVLNWTDPACLLSQIPKWRITIFNSTRNHSIDIPYNCSQVTTDNAANSHRIELVRGQVKCQSKPTNSAFELASCSNYSFKLTPLGGEQVPKEMFSQIVNFTAPLFKNSITSFQVSKRTTNSFELGWTVPSRCSKSQLEQTSVVEIDGTNKKISHDDMSMSDVRGYSRNVSWKNPEALLPCKTYSVQVGSSKQNVTTLPDQSSGEAEEFHISEVTIDGATISWTPPRCENREMLSNWQVEILEDGETSPQKNFNIPADNFVRSMRVGGGASARSEMPALEPCKIYKARVGTRWSDDVWYFTDYKSIATDCPSNITLTVLIVLVVVLIIGVVFIYGLIYHSRKKTKRSAQVLNLANLNGQRPSTSRAGMQPGSTPRAVGHRHKGKHSAAPQPRTAETNMQNDPVPHLRKRPIKVAELWKLDYQQIRQEFGSLKQIAEAERKRLTQIVASRPANKIKNRFINIHPFDYNRVTLSPVVGDPNSDYINASFIEGYNREKEYIAAQGPKLETINEFWRMIWEQNVQLIAMVTSLRENGASKCEKYWPNKGVSMLFGDIALDLLEETGNSFYTKRSLSALKSDITRRITQLHFTAWPDFESPDNPEDLIRFVEVVREELRHLGHTNAKPPILVHCSAGVGRTGTLIALDYLIQEMCASDEIDILKTVLHLRRFRVSMVQSESQYVFLHACLSHYAKTRIQPEDQEPIYENTARSRPNPAGPAIDNERIDGDESTSGSCDQLAFSMLSLQDD